MGPNLKLSGTRDGAEVALPQDLDAIVITTAKGHIYIDLAEQTDNMVLVRAMAEDGGRGRLITSPMSSGRLALGVVAEG